MRVNTMYVNSSEKGCPQKAHVPSISSTLGDTGVYRCTTEPIFIQDPTQPFDLKTGLIYKHTRTPTHPNHRSHVPDLHANFHGGELSEGHLPGLQLPQKDGEAPHVCGPHVDVIRPTLQS